MTDRSFVGLDLGQAQDTTALAVLTRPWVGDDTPFVRRRPPYAVPHLHRFLPGSPYDQVRDAVVDAVARLPRRPAPLVLIDETGVGESVADWFTHGLAVRTACQVLPVTITLAHRPALVDDRAVVPRKSLVGALQLVLQARRLRIARSLPESADLARDLESFRARVVLPDPARDGAVDWRQQPRDDLVLAVALAVWAGELDLSGFVAPD